MNWSDNLERYCAETLLHLKKTKAEGVMQLASEVFKTLEIPSEFHGDVIAVLKRKSLATIFDTGDNSILQITHTGIVYLHNHETELYTKTGKTLSPKIIKSTLAETHERIFQEHKKNDGSLTWTKDAFFPEIPENLQTAKDLLLKQGIIFPSSDKKSTTILSPEVFNAPSCIEAKHIINPTKMKDSEIKDTILGELFVKNHQDSLDLAQRIDVSATIVHALCKQMIKAGHIEAANMDAPTRMFLTITDEGRHFYQTTSYIEQEEKDKTKTTGTHYEISNNSGTIFQGLETGRDFAPILNPSNTPTTEATKEGTKTSIGKFMDNRVVKIIGSIILALISALISAYLVHIFGWA